MESALMDVECARADMDLLRDGFWSKLDRRRARRRRAFAAALFKTAPGVALIILATATPLALPRERPREEAAAFAPGPAVFAERIPSAGLFEPAALPEKQEDVRPGPAEFSAPADPTLHAGAKRAEPEPRLRQAQTFQGRSSRPAGQDGTRAMSLSYENILALVQTGEKALKNETPAIEIEGRTENR
jgi:hypothetical protein